MTFDDDDRRRPLLSVTLPSFGHLVPNGQWRRLLDVARAAEDAGVDRLLVVDHLVMGTHMERYPFGPPPGAPDDPWLEPLTVLAAVSSVTEQVRLATGVLIAPLRNPALLAKSAATLDVLSGGRLELGVGSGWQREEFEAAGVDFDRRGDLLDETLEAVTTLWRDTPASFSGTGLRFDDVHLHPKPQQPAGVPLLIAGGPTPRNLRRLTRWGSGWIPAPRQTPAELAAGVHLVAAAWCEAGRDLAELAVQGSLPVVNGRDGRPDVARSLGEAGALLDAGATIINLSLHSFAAELDDAPRVMREATRRFAALSGLTWRGRPRDPDRAHHHQASPLLLHRLATPRLTHPPDVPGAAP